MNALIAVLFSLLLAWPAAALEPPALEKPDAKRILEFMDWREVTVIAVRQGVDAKGAVAPIYATIIGLGKLRGDHRHICETVYYDKDLDWHALELGAKSARVWNKHGYHDIRPWSTW
jgi:hypothetical protein